MKSKHMVDVLEILEEQILQFITLDAVAFFCVPPIVSFYVCHSCSIKDCPSSSDRRLSSELYVWLFVHPSLPLISRPHSPPSHEMIVYTLSAF